MTKQIVILGAGIGGITAANELLANLPGQYEVVVVDQASHYEFSPSYLWMLAGTRTLAQITRPLDRIARKGLRFIQAKVEAIDPLSRSVTTDQGVLQADYLLIALGANTHMTGLAAVAQAGHNLYSASGAQALHDLSEKAAGSRVAVLVCSMPFKCPAAPYEAAMIWQKRLNGFRSGSQVAIYTPEPGPMPVAGEKVSAQIVQMLSNKKINYFPKHAIQGMTADGQLDFGEQRASFDHLAYVPRHSVPQLLIDAGLAANSGWVPVNRNTMQTQFPGVYAVGDCVGIPLVNGKSLPKAGVFAHGQAEAAARNIIEEIQGRPTSHHFNGYGQCFVEMGGIIAGRGAGNFYAEPNPDVKLNMPGPWHHLGKVMFERFWLNKMY
jgi:sulfide:quinone oxidoreductase